MKSQLMRNAGDAWASRHACALIMLSVLTTAVVPVAHRAAAQAQETPAATRFGLSITAQPLDAALRALSHATGQKIQFAPGQVAHLHSSAIDGQYTAEQALQLMLAGSGLAYATSNGVLHVGSASAMERQDAAMGSESRLPEVLVQGSRVLNIDLVRTIDDEQPYYIYDSQQLVQSGASNVEDFLKTYVTSNAQIVDNTQQLALNGNNSIGAVPANSSINLRGLGSNETLILVDGRRLPSLSAASFGGSGQADINGIPISAVERIEVLPSSASAIYGGSAMGGVINIILKKNYSGGEFSYDFDDTFSGNAQRRNAYLSLGDTLFGGNTRVMLSGHYGNGDPLLLQDRLGIMQSNINLINSRSSGYLYGPSNPFQGSTPNITSADGSNLVLLNGTPLNSPYTTIPAGYNGNGNLAAVLLANAGRQNLKLPPTNGNDGLQYPLNGVPVTKSLNLDVRQKFNDQLEAFLDLSLYGNAYESVFNPLSAQPVSQYFETLPSIPAGSPGNPFQNDINITVPTTTSGPSTSNSVNRSVTAGLIARLGRDWSSEIDYTWSGNSHYWAAYTLDIAQIQAAAAAGTLNLFKDTLANPLDLSQYGGSQGESGGGTVNDVLFRFSGPVGTLPGGRPSVTVGGEHRYEVTETETANDGTYPNFPIDNELGLYYGSSESVDDVYTEGKIPLVGDGNRVPLVNSLSLQIAARYERYVAHVHDSYAFFGGGSDGTYDVPPVATDEQTDYSSFNKTFGLQYRPVESVTLRWSYATAFLPPLASDLLYAPSYAYNVNITDPKNGQTYSVAEWQSGGPWVKPETARTIDIGIIWEPKVEALAGLRVNLERYHIDQPNQLYRYPSAQQIVDTPAFSNWVIRDPTTGLIARVNAYEFNATDYKTSGWDFNIDYPVATAVGKFTVHLQSTYVDHDQRQFAVGTPFLEFAGYPNAAGYNESAGQVKVKANGTLTWARGPWLLGWTTTFLGSYWQVGAPASPVGGGCPSCGSNGAYPSTFGELIAAQGGPQVASQMYHQLFGSYTFERSPTGNKFANGVLSDLVVNFGIHNVFNKVPPLDAFYYPVFTSPFGSLRLRSFDVNVKKSF